MAKSYQVHILEFPTILKHTIMKNTIEKSNNFCLVGNFSLENLFSHNFKMECWMITNYTL